MWTVPPLWKGSRCFIIGGGPSITEQFNIPEKVVQSVYSGGSCEVYAPYMKAIHNEHVIGINMAFKLGSWIDILFFGDGTLFKRKTKEMLDFKGLRIGCDTNIITHNGKVKVLNRSKKKGGITYNPTQVCWNFNSGGAAINLAVHLGVKQIILLGYDMKLDEDKNQHWHKIYHGDKETVNGVFHEHNKCFQYIVDDLKDDIEIINCSPNSNIKEFPKKHIKEVL